MMSMMQACCSAGGPKTVSYIREVKARHTYAAIYALVAPAASNEPIFKDVQDLSTAHSQMDQLQDDFP